MIYSKDEHYTAAPATRISERRDGALPFRTLDSDKATLPFRIAAGIAELDESLNAGMFAQVGLPPPPKWKKRTASASAIQLSDAERARLTRLREQQQQSTTTGEAHNDNDTD
jgi:hypothetical protein